jgi:hypothetical protein
MSAIAQVDIDELADGDAPIDESDMRALLAGTADDRVAYPAAAWLRAYGLARWLGFRETTAQVQAGAAWDRAVDDVAIATTAALLDAN